MIINVPQDHICCLTASVEPAVCTKRDLLFHSRVVKCMGHFGNEGAEQRHLANLAVLVKDVIASAVFPLPPTFCKRLLPPQHKPVEESTLHALPTWVQNLELAPTPFHEKHKTQKSALQQERCRRTVSSANRLWGYNQSQSAKLYLSA